MGNLTLPPILPKAPGGNKPNLPSAESKNSFSSAPPVQDALAQSGPAPISAYDIARAKHLAKIQEKAATPTPSKKSDPYAISTGGSGSAFKDKGASGFKNRFKKEMQKFRGSVTKEERDVLHGVISKRMKSKSTGSSIGRSDRLKMNKEVSAAQKSGDISKGDLKKFKKIISKLD